jgi:cytochrome c-type biogenesis protein CcmH/NrfG
MNPMIVLLRKIAHCPHRLFFLSSLVILAFSSQDNLWGADAGGEPNDSSRILTLNGRVDISRDSGANWTPGRTNMVLNLGNRVRTGRRSRTTIQMTDKSVLRVRQLSTLVIQAPKSSASKPVLDLQSGSSYFFSRESPTEVEFRTPLTSGAIRGTEFELSVGPNGHTEVTMLDGEVYLSNELGAETIVSGEKGIVAPGEKPTKTPVINALNTIQWSLYYPGLLHLGDLDLSSDDQTVLIESLNAYQRGNLTQALELLPEDAAYTSPHGTLYAAVAELSAGHIDTARSLLDNNNQDDLLAAIRIFLAAVQNEIPKDSIAPPTSATHWLAQSYLNQAQHDLSAAKRAIETSLELAPDFGFAWVRLAELEFGEGRTQAAQDALTKAQSLCPDNAQMHALQGFLQLASGDTNQANQAFSHAIALDGALGNAWLGRGLVHIKQGREQEGRLAIQTAAVLEPQRALFRSYLGKAYSAEHLNDLALRDLDRAKSLDPNDPTAWLYSSLVKKEQNQINEAVSDLQNSQRLNDNRGLFRSRNLLDQDQAVRAANLASIYRDAGMTDLSRREASRAVDYDITSPAAHLFLANSYDSLRDPKQINLRYETPWASELFLANLLAPVGAAPLSQNISQHEYSRLFERSGFGLSSNTEYTSNGDWQQTASHYGTFDDFSYSLDVDYRSELGQRPNNDFERYAVWAKAKFNLTEQDSILVQTVYSDYESGDVAQYYDQSTASTTQRVTEVQEPILFIGYHREWHPGSHTLFLASRFDDTLTRTDPSAVITTLNKNPAGAVTGVTPLLFDLDYRRELEGYSAELQHLLKSGDHSFIVGSRYQWADVDSIASLLRSPIAFPPIFTTPPSSQAFDQSLDRFNTYAYYGWDILSNLQVWGGISYDHLDYPTNSEIPPLTTSQSSESQVSPKVGFRWDPLEDTTIRGLYTQSLGGVFFDNSIRLEPTQLGGFNHAFRSIIPESVTGLVPGSAFESFGIAWDQKFPTRTYLSIAAELLRSDASRDQGVFEFATLPAIPTTTQQTLDFEEQSLQITLDQLIDDQFGVGVSYRVSRAQLDQRLPEIPSSVLATANQDLEAILHQARFYARFNHESGFYSHVEGVWSQQSNRGYSPNIPGDDFWQFNAFAGYRFYQRRAQIQLGILNIADQNYQLNPLNLYQELARERMFIASFRFNF